MSKKLILASASPRRRELLQQIGAEFEVFPVNMDESMLPGEGVLQHVQRLATEKARLGFEKLSQQEDELAVLAADTVVEIDGEVLGKPESPRQAAAFLARISGQKHWVHTAIALVACDQSLSAISSSEVEFMPLSDERIAAYVETGEPLDKAGAYAIQGIAGQFVVNLKGSYSGVMGLPLYETAQLFAICGISTVV